MRSFVNMAYNQHYQHGRGVRSDVAVRTSAKSATRLERNKENGDIWKCSPWATIKSNKHVPGNGYPPIGCQNSLCVEGVLRGQQRGHTREDMIALLDEPGMTMKKPLSGFFLLESQPTESHFAAWWSNALRVWRPASAGFLGRAIDGTLHNQELWRNLATAAAATSSTTGFV